MVHSCPFKLASAIQRRNTVYFIRPDNKRSERRRMPLISRWTAARRAAEGVCVPTYARFKVQSFCVLLNFNQFTRHNWQVCIICTPADRQGVDILFTVFCLFVCLCVCTVTDFFNVDKASGVKFCTVVCQRPRRGISRFGELCSPRSPKSHESAAHGGKCQSPPLTGSVWGTLSACVDIQPSPKTDILNFLLVDQLIDWLLQTGSSQAWSASLGCWW